MMQKANLVLILTILTLLVTGCGSLTKMRYSRGFKSNIEFNGRDRTAKTTEYKAAKAVKKGCTPTIAKSTKVITKLTDPINAFTKNTEIPRVGQTQKKATTSNWNKTTTGVLKIPEVARSPKQVTIRHASGPLEPNVLAGAILFYGAVILFTMVFISLVAPTTIFAFLSYFVLLIFFMAASCIMAIIGIILAFIGLIRIHESGGVYRGKWLALSIIIFAAAIIALVAIG